MILTMYLQVTDGSQRTWEGTGELWARSVESATAPVLDDDLVLWPTEDEGPTGGPLWSIKRRYMGSDGSWHIELSRMVVDPSEEARDAIARYSYPSRSDRVWWTASDGAPALALRAGGWLPYDEFRDQGESAA